MRATNKGIVAIITDTTEASQNLRLYVSNIKYINGSKNANPIKYLRSFFAIINLFLYAITQKTTKISEAITHRKKLTMIGLKSISRCFVRTKEDPQKNIEMIKKR